jgi:hypothetical protein
MYRFQVTVFTFLVITMQHARYMPISCSPLAHAEETSKSTSTFRLSIREHEMSGLNIFARQKSSSEVPSRLSSQEMSCFHKSPPLRPILNERVRSATSDVIILSISTPP